MKLTNITRRSALRGATAAFAAAGLPMALPTETLAYQPLDVESDGISGLPLAAVHIERAIAAMATVTMGNWSVKIHSGQPDQAWSFHQESNLVRQAISKHKRAIKEVDDALDRQEAARLTMQAHPLYQASKPKVLVGKFIAMLDVPERPIYAYDVASIEKQSEQWQSAHNAMGRPEQAEACRIKFEGLKQDLDRQIRRQKRIEKISGYAKAREGISAAWRVEEKAAMGVILARPANASEASEKRSYMRGKSSFDEAYWELETLFDALMSQAVQP